MNDELLDYYQRELRFLRELGSEFAQRHPKIAGRLRMDVDAIEDPHVSRFIEASALLAARTRLKIDDEFPDICQALLHTLYPHYLAPMPPSTIVQLKLNEASSDNLDGYVVDRGSRVESEAIDGEPCRFRTCLQTRLWPFHVGQVDYLVPPIPYEASPWNRDVQAAIRVRLVSAGPKVKLSDMKVNDVRFFLGGSTAGSNSLVDAFFSQLLGAAIVAADDTGRAGAAPLAWLPKSSVQPIGYGNDESLLPHNPRCLPAYRILSEFFAANSKFRFVDIQLGEHWTQAAATNRLDLVFFLARVQPVLQRELDRDSIRIGCTPIVNLFFKRAEPIRLTDNVTEYRVIPSARGTANAEIFTIDRVTGLSSTGTEREYLPFFHPSHPQDKNSQQRFWQPKRVPALAGGAEEDRGTEVYLSIVDLQGRPGADEGWTLDVETTCLNRDRVARLPFGGGQPKLSLVEGGASVSLQCITPPTATLRPMDRDDLHWRLNSHLSLNHMVLMDSDAGADALREILRLYNPDDRAEARQIIESVISVKYSRGVARVAGGPAPGFCRGVDVDILLDEERLGGVGAVLFAQVLDRFMGLFATLNSFTRTTVRSVGGDQPLLLGLPRAGSRSLH